MITNCYTIFLVEFLFDVNGDVSKDGVHVSLLVPVANNRHTPVIEGIFSGVCDPRRTAKIQAILVLC